MISFCEDKNEITRIWKKVFGDSEEDILFFLENCKNARCIARFEKERIASMLFLVNCSVGGKSGAYIYAACTEKELEGRGFMTSLLDYSKTLGYAYLCLIPANDALIDYYKKRGFTETADISGLEFNETDEIKEYLFDGYELTEPKLMICEV